MGLRLWLGFAAIIVITACQCPDGPGGATPHSAAQPSDLHAEALPGSGIRLSWVDNSDNESRFTVESSPDGVTGWTVKLHAEADSTTADDLSVKVTTICYYRIQARSPDGDSEWSNTASATSAALLSIGMVQISSAGDSFTMGDSWHGSNVTESFSYSYSVSRYEITNEQFCQFISDGGYDTPDYWTTNGWACRQTLAWWPWPPAGGWEESVRFHPTSRSWYEVVAFCNWRSIKEGLSPVYDSTGRADLAASGYRLPTEVEWEYAAAKGGGRRA